jgi:hypothetical protein
MRKFLLRRPSPAGAIAFVALLLALGGTAYAGSTLGKNSVGSKQIKNGAVVNSKIANGAVGTGKIKNGAVTSSKLNTSGLTVPNATNATNATNAANAGNAATVDGMTVTHFQRAPTETNTPFVIFQADGLTVAYTCFSTGSGENRIDVATTDPNAEINFEGDDQGTFVSNENDGPGTSAFSLFTPAQGTHEGAGLLSYANTSGQTVSIDLGYDYPGAFDAGPNNNLCGVWYTATQS